MQDLMACIAKALVDKPSARFGHFARAQAEHLSYR